jgi:hypothetical protein
MYSARQKELRERRTRAAREDAYWQSEQVAAFEVEESLDFEAPTTLTGSLRRRASAA